MYNRSIQIFIVMVVALSILGGKVSANRPPAIIQFGLDEADFQITLGEAEAGTTEAELSWQVAHLDDYTLQLDHYQIDGWASILEEDEVLSAIGSRSVMVKHPLNFGDVSYRLSIQDEQGNIIDQRFIDIPYQAETKPQELNITKFAPRSIKVLNRDTIEVEIEWYVAHRALFTNIEFDQVLANDEVKFAELPRQQLWIPSTGSGVVHLDIPAPPTSTLLRMQVVDLLTDEALAEAIIEVDVPAEAFTVTPFPTQPSATSAPTAIPIQQQSTAIPSTAVPTANPNAPTIIRLTGSTGTCPPGSPMSCSIFEWETSNASAVSLTQGYLENGIFYPSYEAIHENLPANGTFSFKSSINN